MKSYKKSIKLLILLSISLTIRGMESQILSEEQALKETSARIVEVLRSMITKHPIHGYQISKTTALFPWLPGYIVKLNTDRIEGAEQILNPCIVEEGLNLLRVAKMRSCPVPPKHDLPDDLGKVCLPHAICLAEYIMGTHIGKMTLLQTKQMVTLLRKGKKTFLDCYGGNIIYTPNGEVALIDTELRGFAANRAKEALEHLYLNNDFEPDAKEYLKNVIEEMQP